MPLGIFPALLGLSAVVTLLCGIWLVIHARDVAALFRDTDSSPQNRALAGSGPRQPRGRVWAFLIAFNLGWIACVACWYAVASGVGNDVVESHDATVQRP